MRKTRIRRMLSLLSLFAVVILTGTLCVGWKRGDTELRRRLRNLVVVRIGILDYADARKQYPPTLKALEAQGFLPPGVTDNFNVIYHAASKPCEDKAHPGILLLEEANDWSCRSRGQGRYILYSKEFLWLPVSNKRDEFGSTPLHQAFLSGDVVKARLLLERRGADVNAQNDRGSTPLHEVAAMGEKRLIEWLLKHGADVNAKDNNGHAPLHNCIVGRICDEEICQTLLAHGAEVDIFIAAGLGMVDVMSDMLDADPKLANSSAWFGTPLHYAASAGQLEAIRLLIARGGDVNAKNSWKATPLLYAATEAADLLVSEGAELDMEAAVVLGKTDVVRRLLRRRPELVNSLEHALLHQAAQCGQVEVVRLLLTKGADVNGRGPGGYTPLYCAITGGHLAAAEVLLANGADVNAGERTPLHQAAAAGNAELVRLLLTNGANVKAKQDGEFTPLHLAAFAGNKQTIELLLAHGAEVNARSHQSGDTPLHDVIQGSCFRKTSPDTRREIAQLLVLRGADVNCTDKLGWTPLGLAACRGDRDLVKFLRQHGASVWHDDFEWQRMSAGKLGTDTILWALCEPATNPPLPLVLLTGKSVSVPNGGEIREVKGKASCVDRSL